MLQQTLPGNSDNCMPLESIIRMLTAKLTSSRKVLCKRRFTYIIKKDEHKEGPKVKRKREKTTLQAYVIYGNL